MSECIEPSNNNNNNNNNSYSNNNNNNNTVMCLHAMCAMCNVPARYMCDVCAGGCDAVGWGRGRIKG